MRVKWSTASGLANKQAELMKVLEISQIKKQIEVLLTFLPDEILYLPMEELSKVHKFVGVLLFADVSGFTPLTEKYNKTGKGGIYKLTATLNAYIGAIVEVIYYFGGDVLKFSGDAFLALWKAPTDVCLYEVIHEVIVCALFIQKTLGFFETEVNVLLKVKLAISCGNLTISVIGDDKFKHYVILGQAVNDVKAAEHVSISGDIVVSPAAWGHLAEDGYDVTHTLGGNVKVWQCTYKPSQKEKEKQYKERFREITKLCQQHIELRNALHQNKKLSENITDSYLIEKFVQSLPPRKTMKVAVQQWIMKELSPFIIKPVLEQVEEMQPLQYLTEMREVTIQFINIVPSTFDENRLVVMVDSAYKIVCNIASDVLGVVNKVSLFDKDAMMLVLFGLKGVGHELESQNALKSAYQIRKDIVELEDVKSVSVGITHGLVYCGVVGHPLRKEYTVIGGPVNKAARIMCAYEHKVTCDYETYTNSKLSSTYFQLQSAYKLKGIENAGNIFEYNENFEEEGQAKPQTISLIGRMEEIGFVEEILAGQHSFSGVLFKGADKSGKTSLLEYFYDECLKRDLLPAFVALHEGNQRPYHCISLIYRQMFDRLSSIQTATSSLENFKRNIWNFNEILQEKLVPLSNEVTDRKKSISDSFRQLCGSKQTVIIVDNVQFLDLRSFEIIDDILKTGNFKLISAGTFSETTWDTLFQFSLSDRVKVVDLAPLESCWIAPLICRFLKVVGVPKSLVHLVEKSCEGRPGWIQSCLLKLVNNSGIKIEYVLPDSGMQDWVIFPPNEMTALELLGMGQEYLGSMLTLDQVVPIVVFAKDKNENVKDLTLAAISLDLFDSFTPYEQLIIKTAAVLGVTFTRTLLVIMLKYPNMQTFNNAMRHLFEEGVFECGTKYISSGGRYSRQTTCSCYLTLDQLELEAIDQNLPKYSYCKNLHFKNGTLRSVAYELIPANQRKELHLKTTEILENQNNSCPNCLRDDSPVIFQFHKFSRMAQESEGRTSKSGFGVSSQDNNVTTEKIKDVIRANIEMNYSEPTAVSVFVPSRKVWDPTVCFCLEILTRVYGDLVYHSGQAGHASKTMFFLYQNGLILSLLDELEDAVEVLKEASELCIRHIYARSRVKLSFAKYIFAKICSLLAELHFSLNNWKAAKNYCMLTLRQFDVPMTSLSLTGRVKIFNRLFADHRRLDQHSKDSIGKCLSVVSRIFAAEGRWNLAIGVANKSLELVKYSNPNVELLCDVYSNALDMHCFRDDGHVCEQLVRNLGQELTRLYGNNLTSEIFAVAKLMYVVFQVKAKAGALVVATRMGFRLFELNRLLHAYVFQLEMIPILCFLLICQKRLDDVVFTAKYLKNMGKKYDQRGETAYYAICLMMISETNFHLEPMEELEAYADKIFIADKTTTAYYNPLHDTLALYVISQLLRKGKINKASKWRQFQCNPTETARSFFGFWNRLKYTENTLLLLCRDLGSKTNIPDFVPQKIRRLLDECGKQMDVWRVFMPRYLHCVAYYKKLRGKGRRAMEVLKEAIEEARKAENVLEECWIALNENYWKGDYYFPEGKGSVFWRSANFYGKEDWSQMMNVLPLP
ncbi:adenylate cyclase type 10-like [Coccinella septempunctata]|uniref:adenylate cyclase type 10-like n=1 Tax=Coccinella septempunctata TaxID=41139 RepID=UPI001D07F5F1|nr:adenylate cyclase type 10-like [Coccinella septempunctata]